MFGIGAGEFIVIIIAGLILFGPGKLPEVGRAIGKGLREFRKAQAALTATLNEVSEEPKKKSQPADSVEKNSDSLEEVSRSTMSADDVINLAKQSPIHKENLHEKNSDDNVDNVAPSDNDGGNADTRSNSNGTEQQSELTKN